MTGEPTCAALRDHNTRVAGMLADPECVGELLLVGLAMARSVDLADPPWPAGEGMDLRQIADRVYGRYHQHTSLLVPNLTAHGSHLPRKRIRDLFRHDRRRYDPDLDAGAKAWGLVSCGRPMVRRSGLCGRSVTSPVLLTDPATGLRSYVGACSQKACRAWLGDLVARNRTELKTSLPPVPPANAGGVLERHLPEIDWWKVWRHVDPAWTPPPEGRAFERPKLTVLVGDDEPEVTVASRPALAVLDGGWR